MFFYTSDFEKSLKRLERKKKYGYSTCKGDIKYVVGHLSFEQVWEMRDNIFDDPPFRIIKVRIPNSGRNLSKKEGFRLIMILNKDKKTVTFLYVYPMKGKYSRLNVSKKDLHELLTTFAKESNPNYS
jgi:mRNA-degrading endonuclease RelE of RelBE toxin-antitoxin system